ncbi:MAG: hypothetical protein SQA66_05320 [Candidatus Fervidibacter sacchari]
MERWVVKAVVQGKTLVLEEELPLPDGTTVTVTVIPQDLEEQRRQALYAQLEAKGLIKVPKTLPDKITHNPPIAVTGKPLSQIIIEERRR